LGGNAGCAHEAFAFRVRVGAVSVDDTVLVVFNYTARGEKVIIQLSLKRAESKLTYRFPSANVRESLIVSISALTFAIPTLHRLAVVAEEAVNLLEMNWLEAHSGEVTPTTTHITARFVKIHELSASSAHIGEIVSTFTNAIALSSSTVREENKISQREHRRAKVNNSQHMRTLNSFHASLTI
jgi:hypothetical protein